MTFRQALPSRDNNERNGLSLPVFMNMPLVFPSGSFATIKIDQAPIGFHVSDHGFAYRELEQIGAERSFAKTADAIINAEQLERNRRAIFVTCAPEELDRAIMDVAAASWRVVDRIYSRLHEAEELELEEELKERLAHLFGDKNVSKNPTLTGVSSTTWPMTAVVKKGSHDTVFQAVSSNANSIFRTSAAFRDLILLEKPPVLVAVVRDKPSLGPKQTIITQAGGKVIQEDQPDNVFLRVAA